MGAGIAKLIIEVVKLTEKYPKIPKDTQGFGEVGYEICKL
jgi:hypothetical protein